MELPAVLTILVCFLLASETGTVPVIFLALWQLHYLHRTFIYPFRIRAQGKMTPLLNVVLAF